MMRSVMVTVMKRNEFKSIWMCFGFLFCLIHTPSLHYYLFLCLLTPNSLILIIEQFDLMNNHLRPSLSSTFSCFSLVCLRHHTSLSSLFSIGTNLERLRPSSLRSARIRLMHAILRRVAFKPS
jgi:hypothetical protein